MEGEVTAAAVKEFINKNKLPLVVEFTQEVCRFLVIISFYEVF